MKRNLRILTVAMLIVAMFVTSAQAITFTKLDNNKIFDEKTIQQESMDGWAKDEIMAAQNAGLIPPLTGNPSYKANISREQFAELVVRAVEVILNKEAPAAAADKFTDTSNEEILKAYQMGIIAGRGNGIFDPNSNANRQEIATMISRAIFYIQGDTGVNLAPVQGSVDSFADKDQIDRWARGGVGMLAANNIMAGKLDNTTGKTYASPKANCTVQESILLLYRLYNNSL